MERERSLTLGWRALVPLTPKEEGNLFRGLKTRGFFCFSRLWEVRWNSLVTGMIELSRADSSQGDYVPIPFWIFIPFWKYAGATFLYLDPINIIDWVGPNHTTFRDPSVPE